jgi:exodeoxyribonuclease V alpha subunit
MPEEAGEESLEGTVARVVFRAPDGLFAVLRLDRPSERGAPVTVIGPLAEAEPGEHLRLAGRWERHATFGDQFRATRAIAELPRTADGVERYLEGFAGFGATLAERLVGAFGAEALEVLEREPWRAAQVKGIGKRRAERAQKEAIARRAERDVMIFLQGLGVSAAYAVRIRKTYGADAVAKVRDNPYRLARDVPGIGFHVADRIARGMGIGPSHPLRVQGGLLHALDTLAEDGHVRVARPVLSARASELLAVDPSLVTDAERTLLAEGAVIEDGGALYLPVFHRAEVELARRLLELAAAPRSPAPPVEPASQSGSEIALSTAQREAIVRVGRATVSVITGGPGTGKTTMVRTLVRSFQRAGLRVRLAAPTGRAAKRLSEATGRGAVTVHRLLGWGQGGRRGEEEVLVDCDLLVIDEASMLDLLLARALFAAVRPGTRVVLVGDVDQLPSVGPGQVLRDVIESGTVEVARLREVFRQAEGSGIIESAYRILSGEVPMGATQPGPADFYLVATDDPVRARELAVRMLKERIPEAFGLDPVTEVQVLSPMHRGAAGTEALNRALQEALNPNGAAIGLGGDRGFRVGDKVMQLKNDYERDVFNGDVGVIVAAHAGGAAGDQDAIEVAFDDRRVRYDREALSALELAYAVSVHKSQGSEYPAVVVLLLAEHHVLLQRNLLYTAVTRGKRLVVLLAEQRALKRAVSTEGASLRSTGLRARLSSSAAFGHTGRG